MKKRPVILVHQNELTSIGVEIKPFSKLNMAVQIPHRDDHYMFIIQQRGLFVWDLEFKEVVLSGAVLCFIAPGQVHRYTAYDQCEGWLVFVDSELISGGCREIFDICLHTHQSVAVQEDDLTFKIPSILEEMIKQQSMPLRKTLINSITDTLTNLVASKVVQSKSCANLIASPKYDLVLRFKKLLNVKYKELKQVKAYASLLNITPLYLNEVVREITGFSASYWINQKVLLEGKRMLYYTNLDVKQIAYELGFEDHAYFSRFFKKNTGNTALEFRSTNHYLSNHSH